MCAEYPRRRLSRHAKNQTEMTGGSERTAGLAPNSLPRAISRALRPISSSQLANDSCAMLIGLYRLPTRPLAKSSASLRVRLSISVLCLSESVAAGSGIAALGFRMGASSGKWPPSFFQLSTADRLSASCREGNAITRGAAAARPDFKTSDIVGMTRLRRRAGVWRNLSVAPALKAWNAIPSIWDDAWPMLG